MHTKVEEFVKAFKEDGHTFIPESASRLLHDIHFANVPIKMSRSEATSRGIKGSERFTKIQQPRFFSHYVMNLPSTAIDFLPNFIGLYQGAEEKVHSIPGFALPMVHCYCFGPKNEEGDVENLVAKTLICQQISERLKSEITPSTPELHIYDVRDVAPNKRQFCASFRLPADVAFRDSAAR